MGIKEIEPLYELKGHKSPVISLAYSEKSAIGDSVLASGSGMALHFKFTLKTH